jgi:hypothetical protein
MKKLIPISLIALCLSFFLNTTKAQLVAGDIAFTGYIGNQTAVLDQFTFVVLKNISSGTVIKFTDNAWLATNTFNNTETILTFTTTVPLIAGNEVKIVSADANGTLSGTGTNVGSITSTGGALSLAVTGDQVLAYIGADASPTFIAAIHMNTYTTTLIGTCGNTTTASWDPACIGSGGGFSTLPTGLTDGVNALWIGDASVTGAGGEFDNAYFNCGGSLTTVSGIRAAANNAANWVKDNSLSGPALFTLPRNCNFLNVLATNTINFTAKLNTNNTSTLQWKVEDFPNINKFNLEKSTDGISFKPLSTINTSSSTSGTYSYTDNELLVQNNYYRINIIELSGKSFYSNTVAISPKAMADITVFPNPVADKFTIQQLGSQYSKTAFLMSATGKIEQQINITSQQHTVNTKSLSAGIYYLKMDNGKVFKIVKQ